MAGHDRKSRLLNVTALLLPLVLVKGTALTLGEGPAKVEASGGGKNGKTTKIALHPSLPKWSKEQMAAAKRIEDLRSQDFGSSPLLHGVQPQDDGNPKQPNTTREPPPPNMTLRMVMITSRGNVALMSRGRYRVGDAVGTEGWVVHEINRRSLVLIYPETGTTKQYDVPMPR